MGGKFGGGDILGTLGGDEIDFIPPKLKNLGGDEKFGGMRQNLGGMDQNLGGWTKCGG